MTDAIDRGRSQAPVPCDRREQCAGPGAGVSGSQSLSSEGKFAEALRVAEQTARVRRTDAGVMTPAELTGPHVDHAAGEQDATIEDGRASVERRAAEGLLPPHPYGGGIITRAFHARDRARPQQQPLIADLAALVRTDAFLVPTTETSRIPGGPAGTLQQAADIVRQFAEHLELAHDDRGNVTEVRFRMSASRFGAAVVTCRIEDGELLVIVMTETHVSAEVIERVAQELRAALSRIFANPRIKMGNQSGDGADTLGIRKPLRHRSDEQK